MKKNIKDNIDRIIKKAKRKEGVVYSVNHEKFKNRLKISNYSNGSYIFNFQLPNNKTKESSDKIKKAFFNMFDGVNFKKEFNENLIFKNGYFQTWIYKGNEDERVVIEHLLNLQYHYNWEITNILN